MIKERKREFLKQYSGKSLCLRMAKYTDAESIKETKRDMCIQQCYPGAPNVIAMRGTMVIMESGGEDLSTIAGQQDSSDFSNLGRMYRQRGENIRDAHEMGLINRDIKPDNLTENYIIDVGESVHVSQIPKILDKCTRPDIGTPQYWDPSLFDFERVDGRMEIKYKKDLTAANFMRQDCHAFLVSYTEAKLGKKPLSHVVHGRNNDQLKLFSKNPSNGVKLLFDSEVNNDRELEFINKCFADKGLTMDTILRGLERFNPVRNAGDMAVEEM